MTLLQRQLTALMVCLVVYGVIFSPFSEYMKQKPVEEKLGYLPSVNALRYMSADHKELVGASLVIKVLMYFGGVFQKQQENVITQPPDYRRMSGILHAAVMLDPYNLDAYYFAQSFLTWEVKQYKLANSLLDYGMKYRNWDWMLPFFAGFNSAYFLKDYESAAKYYKHAGELSGSEFHVNLASRYMLTSGQTELAIKYLTAMVNSERNQAVKMNYQKRLAAVKEVYLIERAIARYKEAKGTLPQTIQELVTDGFLSSTPRDPYGGKFFLDPDGRVTATGNLAIGGEKR